MSNDPQQAVTEAKVRLKDLYGQVSEMFQDGAAGDVLMHSMCSGVDALLLELW